LEQVAVLLELSGANGFKVRAYQNASRALSSMEEDLFLIISEGKLLQVKGRGLVTAKVS
jgi:DNA polymerase (family 10)